MIPRAEVLEGLRKSVAEHRPLIGAGVGTGLSAKCAERGGADLLIIYNSGRYRMAGRGSWAGVLAYGDANAIVVDMAAEVLPVVRHTPVLAGVNGTDPFRLMPRFLRSLREIGFSGVQNYPTVGLFDGIVRRHLEETGMGYGLEVEMIRQARALDLLTCAYAFNPREAEAMAEAGADILVAHMGLTTDGLIGAQTAISLEECVPLIQNIHDAATRISPEIMVLCHGGPISDPEDAAFILASTRGVVGFFGASSIERIPSERAIIAQVQAFKGLSVSRL